MDRAVSPVIGTVVLVVIVILLASTFTVGLPGMVDFGRLGETVEGLREAPDDHSIPTGELVSALEDDALESGARHRIEFHIRDGSNTAGNSLNVVQIEYEATDVTAMDARSDVTKLGIDTDGDRKVDVNAHGDLECCPPSDGVIVTDGGHTLRLELSGNYNLEEDDTVIVVYDDVTNPGEGTYDVTVSVNGDVSRTGQLTTE
ncbi:MAG: archaellin/type IV pilin N-terminal domain-containing protein [Halobacteriaceae archaeon]